MKQIINGKRYDTFTATEIAEYDTRPCPGEYNYDDFNYIYEILYRTDLGAWFIEGEGGAHTVYGYSTRYSRNGETEIRPLTPSEAQKWLEAHNETEALEKWFGDKIVDA